MMKTRARQTLSVDGTSAGRIWETGHAGRADFYCRCGFLRRYPSWGAAQLAGRDHLQFDCPLHKAVRESDDDVFASA